MPWDKIATALKKRLDGVTPKVGMTHDYIRWTEDTDQSTDFKSKFHYAPTGRTQFWMVYDEGLADIFAQDSDRKIIRRYNTVLEGFYAHNDKGGSETAFKQIVDAVMEDLRLGDRTLGGIVNTIQPPTVKIPRSGVVFQGMACNYASVSFGVEEILTRRVTDVPAPTINPSPADNSLYFPIQEIVDGLLATVAGTAVPYAVPAPSSVTLCRGSRPDPIYPADPRKDCPFIRLRLRQMTNEPVTGRAGQVVDSQFLASWYIYHRQKPGEDHQQLVANKAQLISKPFLGNFTPAALASIPRLIDYQAVPVLIINHNDLRHPWGDPDLTVSCVEVQMKLQLRVRICPDA